LSSRVVLDGRRRTFECVHTSICNNNSGCPKTHTLRICRTLALVRMARRASQGVYKEDFGQKRGGGSWSTILWWERMSWVKDDYSI